MTLLLLLVQDEGARTADVPNAMGAHTWFIILAAGVYKLPDLLGPLGDGIRGQALVGSLFAGVAAYLSVRFLMKYFRTRTLYPFAIYCLAFGLASVIYLSVK